MRNQPRTNFFKKKKIDLSCIMLLLLQIFYDKILFTHPRTLSDLENVLQPIIY